MTSTIRSAIVLGAGIAGLSCATELARAGITVTLLDKGRRPGGRVATRRMDGVSFNHGAQFATARGEEFGALLTELRTNGQAAVWPAAGGGHPRIVFLPCMSALPAVLAARATDLGVTILTERQAVFLHQAGPSWTVRHMNAVETTPGTTAASGGLVSPPHDAVLLAMPASQAKALVILAKTWATAYFSLAPIRRRGLFTSCAATVRPFRPEPTRA
jgi:predicted NAD/FAD-dependent oxidoreductase